MSSSISSNFLKEREIDVLLVDDEPELLEQAQMFMGKNENDLRIETTTSPEKALEELESGNYDVVVSDYKMPEMDGLDFLRAVREDLESDILLIIFTGKGEEEISLNALDLGADRYLRKGGDPKKRFEVLENTILQEVEKRRNKEELSIKSNLLDSMFENFPASLYVKDKEGRILLASRSLKEDYRDDGYEQIIGKTDFDLMPQEAAEKARETEKEVMESEEPITQIERSQAYDGTELYLQTTKAPIYGENGNVAGVVGVTRDISERMSTGEALRKSEREKRWILDSTFELIVHQDLNHRIKWLNRSAREKIGEEFESREGKGPKCYEVWPGLDEPCDNCPIEKALETGERQEEEIAFPNGRIWRIKGNPVRNEEGEIVRVVEIAEDVTERKKLEEELSRERALFESLMESLPASVYFKNRDGRLMRVSDYYVEQSGSPDVESPDDVIGKTDFDLYPEDLAEKAREDEKRIMETREPIVGEEEENISPEGDKVYLRTTKAPLVNEEDEVIGSLGITQDITERKMAEQREDFLHSLLRHDIRNKAQIVEGYLELLESIDPSESGEDYLSKAQKALGNSLELIEKVRAMREAEREEVEERVEVDEVVKDSLEELRSQASENEIELCYEECGCSVLGGPLLEELFFNLVENSIEHADCDKIVVAGEERDGECVVSVEDDGKGVPDEEKGKIFQRGYKGESSSGSGVGMQLVKSIAESYGGKVKAMDSDMGGARFDVHLKKTS